MASLGGVVVNFMARTRDAIRDVTKFTDSLEDNQDAADDLDKALTDAEREFDKIGRESADLAADLRKTDDAFTDVSRESDKMADDLRRDFAQAAQGVKQGADDIERETDGVKTSMKETGKEAGAEFIGNMAEGIGSGSMNVTDVVQGTLGGLVNLAASIGGPIGIAAGVAAAGIGTLFAAQTAAAQKAKEQVEAITAALIEVGNTSSDAAKKVLWDQWVASLDEGGKQLSEIADGVRDAGIDAGVFQEAIKGSVPAQKQVRDKIAEAITKIEDLKTKQGGLGVLDAERLRKLKLVNQQLGIGEDSIDTANGLLADTELLTGDAAEAAEKYAEELRGAKGEAKGIKDNINDIPGSKAVNVIVAVKDKNGRPVKLGPGQLSADGLGLGVSTMRVAEPIVVNVTANGVAAPSNPRELVALLESHQVRMGRKAGAPRARAW